MKILCVPCWDSQGEKVEAQFLAPQQYGELKEDFLHWVPVCTGHVDGWFDDCDEEFFKLKLIAVSQTQ